MSHWWSCVSALLSKVVTPNLLLLSSVFTLSVIFYSRSHHCNFFFFSILKVWWKQSCPPLFPTFLPLYVTIATTKPSTASPPSHRPWRALVDGERWVAWQLGQPGNTGQNYSFEEQVYETQHWSTWDGKLKELKEQYTETGLHFGENTRLEMETSLSM